MLWNPVSEEVIPSGLDSIKVDWLSICGGLENAKTSVVGHISLRLEKGGHTISV